jgi:hypothetical protein
MSSKNSITQLSSFVTKNILLSIPKKLRPLYMFGIRSFTVQPMVSCNGNARTAHSGSRQAAEQQMYRLLHHSKLFLLVWRAVAKSMPLSSADLVNVDYSNLDPLSILGFAKQTRRGRAIPVLMRTLASNTQGLKKDHHRYKKLKDDYADWKKTLEADQYSFVVKSLRLLQYLYRCQPRLVFDRGFVNQDLVRFMYDNSWTFYVRMREDFLVVLEKSGERVRAGSLTTGEHQINYAGRRMRLIVTKPRKRYPNPWFIITNDETTTVEKITKFYYHRFEIEECFRDLKSIYQLKGSRLRSWRSLRVILCFMSIAIILAMNDKKLQKHWDEVKTNVKKKLSIVRMWQEQLHRHEISLLSKKLGVA